MLLTVIDGVITILTYDDKDDQPAASIRAYASSGRFWFLASQGSQNGRHQIGGRCEWRSACVGRFVPEMRGKR